jgi:hypothetical protein
MEVELLWFNADIAAAAPPGVEPPGGPGAVGGAVKTTWELGIDELVGVRTKKINAKLKSFEELPANESKGLLDSADDTEI